MGKNDRRRVLLVPSLLAACVVGVAGCSGGGSSAPSPAPAPTPVPPPPPPPPSAASIQVLPASFDFGKVTTNNSSAPLQVTISNTGTTPLTVSAITLSAPSGPPYALAVGGGAKPCGSATPTIAAADSCTVQVLFAPTTAGTFTSTLQVTSNATERTDGFAADLRHVGAGPEPYGPDQPAGQRLPGKCRHRLCFGHRPGRVHRAGTCSRTNFMITQGAPRCPRRR